MLPLICRVVVILLISGLPRVHSPAPQEAAAAQVERLADPDPQTRQQAAAALVAGGRESVGALIHPGLDHGDGTVRLMSAKLLGRLGPDAAQAVPSLGRLLSDPDRTLRIAAAEALANIGPAAAASTAELLNALNDDNAKVRWSAASALAAVGTPAVDGLRNALRSSSEERMVYAALALEGMGPSAASAAPELIDIMAQGTPRVRRQGARALGRIGAAPGVAAALTRALGDPDELVIADAAQGLGALGHDGEDVLLASLSDRDPLVRGQAMRVLPQFGPPIVPLLRDIARHGSSPAVQAAAAEVMVQTLARTPQAVAALSAALADPSAEIRQQAAGTLARLMPQARAAVPALLACFRDDDPRVRRFAAAAIGKATPRSPGRQAPPDLEQARAATGGGATMARLAQALLALTNDPDAEVRSAAIEALPSTGPEPRAAVQALISRLQDTAPEVRRQAALLGRYGHAAAAGIDALIGALNDSDPEVRRRSAWSLGQLGPTANSALPALSAAAGDPQPAVRQSAADAIRRIQSPSGVPGSTD